MTRITPATALMAANDNADGTATVQVALRGLVVLLARAELQDALRKPVANTPRTPNKQENTQ